MTVILVTGASGFIGRAVVRRLLVEGATVLGCDLGSTALQYSGYRHAICDVTDFAAVCRMVDEACPIAVVHTAAIVGMDAAKRDVLRTTSINILGTHHVLEALRRCGGRRFVQISTQDVYGDFDGGIARENQLLEPKSLYGTTKLAAELLVQQYGEDYGLEVASLRGAWIYGAGMEPHKFPRSAIEQARATGTIIMPSGAESEMDLIHIDDFSELVWRALTRPLAGHRVFNAGSGMAWLMPEVCKAISERFGGMPVEIGGGRFRTAGCSEVPRQGALDISLARAVLGFSPTIDIQVGLDDLCGLAYNLPAHR